MVYRYLNVCKNVKEYTAFMLHRYLHNCPWKAIKSKHIYAVKESNDNYYDNDDVRCTTSTTLRYTRWSKKLLLQCIHNNNNSNNVLVTDSFNHHRVVRWYYIHDDMFVLLFPFVIIWNKDASCFILEYVSNSVFQSICERCLVGSIPSDVH